VRAPDLACPGYVIEDGTIRSRTTQGRRADDDVTRRGLSIRFVEPSEEGVRVGSRAGAHGTEHVAARPTRSRVGDDDVHPWMRAFGTGVAPRDGAEDLHAEAAVRDGARQDADVRRGPLVHVHRSRCLKLRERERRLGHGRQRLGGEHGDAC